MTNLYRVFPIAVFFAACSICDPGEEHSEDVSRYVGTFKLTAWNAPIPVDFDQDGDASRNLVTESECYHPSKIILNPDRNFIKHEHYPDVQSGAETCAAVIITGVWSASGNTVKLIPTEGTEEIYNYGQVNENLTRSEINWEYPTIIGSEASYAYGDVNMVFTKE